MSRSVWKPVYIEEDLLQESKVLKTLNRNCIITKDFLGKVFQIHNGIKYIDVEIQEDMLGHKLGEFASSHKKPSQKKKQKNKKK